MFFVKTLFAKKTRICIVVFFKKKDKIRGLIITHMTRTREDTLLNRYYF